MARAVARHAASGAGGRPPGGSPGTFGQGRRGRGRRQPRQTTRADAGDGKAWPAAALSNWRVEKGARRGGRGEGGAELGPSLGHVSQVSLLDEQV